MVLDVADVHATRRDVALGVCDVEHGVDVAGVDVGEPALLALLRNDWDALQMDFLWPCPSLYFMLRKLGILTSDYLCHSTFVQVHLLHILRTEFKLHPTTVTHKSLMLP